ncbi:MAG: hypothetical protein ACXACK_18220 [Candidatus Hodarchaeales archaeon]|jgi:hypothetical protein
MFYIRPRTKELIVLTLISLLVAIGVVFLIILIFIISGNQNLLTQMLESTAEGQIAAIGITAGGPFGMWVIAFLVIIYARKEEDPSLGVIRLYLRFKLDDIRKGVVPSTPSHFNNAQCSYSIFSDGNQVSSNNQAIILFQRYVGPYISVQAPGIQNPVFTVTLEYQGQTLHSKSSYEPTRGEVTLQ